MALRVDSVVGSGLGLRVLSGLVLVPIALGLAYAGGTAFNLLVLLAAALMAESGFDVIDMLGKTVLPMRDHRDALLRDSAEGRAWARIEKSLCRDAAAMGRASHLQVVAKRH